MFYMLTIHSLQKVAQEDEEAGVHADLAFHMAIAESTHNSVLQQLIAVLAPQMHNTMEVTRKHLYHLALILNAHLMNIKRFILRLAVGKVKRQKH